MKLTNILNIYSPNRGFRVWRRINPNKEWCYKVVADCRSENNEDFKDYLEREVERIDVVDSKLEIFVEQVGEDEFFTEEELSEEYKKMREA